MPDPARQEDLEKLREFREYAREKAKEPYVPIVGRCLPHPYNPPHRLPIFYVGAGYILPGLIHGQHGSAWKGDGAALLTELSQRLKPAE